MNVIDENTLARIEMEHTSGLTSAEILDVFAAHAIPLSEATLRKYVQLGLLPRSVRVGRKGKHQGSQGLYPASVVRQILSIKRMMAASLTIEQIQREFLFMRSDLEALERTLDEIFGKLGRALEQRRNQDHAHVVTRQVKDVRTLGRELLSRLVAIESRLTSAAGPRQAVAS
jgi:DNA-binding transcriptional MerR regulator